MKEWIVYKNTNTETVVVAAYPTEGEALDYIHTHPQEAAVLYVQESNEE